MSRTGVIPNNQPQAEIFKSKIDHFEELFDWLALGDLAVLAKTCKRMQQIVGYYFKPNYAAIKPKFRSDGIRASDDNFQIKLDGLSSFLKNLEFHYLEHIEYDHGEQKWISISDMIPNMKADQFKSITEIHLSEVIFTDKGISHIKEILGQLETVKLKQPIFRDDNKELYKSFLRFCTSLKKLCIDTGTFIVGVDNSWLRRKYPTLEHFELTTEMIYFHMEITELRTFFHENSKIKSFATSVEMLLANRNTFSNTELKLDTFSIKFKQYDSACELNLSRIFLNELHERGLFKQLHVYVTTVDYQEEVNQFTSFNGLTKLFAADTVRVDLSPLINLKHLCINRASSTLNMETMARQLINLEFFQFTYASLDQIKPFVRYSLKLNTIVVFHLEENNENTFKIKELNEERSKLTNWKKITIYVDEHVYLRVKCAKGETNWNLIEIKRGASYDALNHNFQYMHDSQMTF